MRAGDVPATPTLLKGARMIGHIGSRARARPTIDIGVDATNEIAWNALRARRSMTRQALTTIADDSQGLSGILVNRIKHCP